MSLYDSDDGGPVGGLTLGQKLFVFGIPAVLALAGLAGFVIANRPDANTAGPAVMRTAPDKSGVQPQTRSPTGPQDRPPERSEPEAAQTPPAPEPRPPVLPSTPRPPSEAPVPPAREAIVELEKPPPDFFQAPAEQGFKVEPKATRPPPTEAEVQRDSQLVQQYVESNVIKRPLSSGKLCGPWRAVDGAKEGRFYRLQALTGFLNKKHQYEEKSVAYCFFMCDGAVARHQPDPGDLEQVTICKVREPLVPKKSEPPKPAAQEPKGAPDELATPVPGKPLKNQLLKQITPGYEPRLVEGFTVLLSTQAVKEGKKDSGHPFDVLNSEFAGLVEVLPDRALKLLRTVPIWVEWNNSDPGNPCTLAMFRGGPHWSVLSREHPAKPNSVVLLSLKRLTDKKDRSPRRTLVLLHELAHAVHFTPLLVGYDNPHVKLAYQQAMDRGLYDLVETDFGTKTRAYAATSESEYFAELTCAYLDRCDYFPFTRAELERHDPTGFKVMQAVWGPKPDPKRRR